MDIRVSIIAKNKYTQSFIQILSYQIVSDVSTTITGASAHIIYLLCGQPSRDREFISAYKNGFVFAFSFASASVRTQG